ncbi:hypothetical protein HETIRDRAFT_103482 [Heterobasidion irregulare TC 32-1]|uniref:Uncharacterized protein n=1 Tax=Heterobasidion irregulare (strain TC 32-1) TaxID=747525 RepID=W4K4K4_HETIT|nr:uncharacterized protein HETIRDRAFT_103482 [Heterobasidion irregulare TC 32-1]ETW79976.1 hypothetical protein HETIRDRAFT_103482 [Heterobasidion irregulare TC 32-1]
MAQETEQGEKGEKQSSAVVEKARNTAKPPGTDYSLTLFSFSFSFPFPPPARNFPIAIFVLSHSDTARPGHRPELPRPAAPSLSFLVPQPEHSAHTCCPPPHSSSAPRPVPVPTVPHISYFIPPIIQSASTPSFRPDIPPRSHPPAGACTLPPPNSEPPSLGVHTLHTKQNAHFISAGPLLEAAHITAHTGFALHAPTAHACLSVTLQDRRSLLSLMRTLNPSQRLMQTDADGRAPNVLSPSKTLQKPALTYLLFRSTLLPTYVSRDPSQLVVLPMPPRRPATPSPISERKLKPSLFDPSATTGGHENRRKRLEVVLGFNSHPARRLPARRNTTIPRFGYILRWQSSSHGAPASSNVLLGPSRCRAGCDSLVPLRSTIKALLLSHHRPTWCAASPRPASLARASRVAVANPTTPAGNCSRIPFDAQAANERHNPQAHTGQRFFVPFDQSTPGRPPSKIRVEAY